MERRVAICAVAQTPYRRQNVEQRFQGMALDVLESLLEQTGLDFAESGGIDAATISSSAWVAVSKPSSDTATQPLQLISAAESAAATDDVMSAPTWA